jgi:glycosyltransferase involved in cell wall biosynthesis
LILKIGVISPFPEGGGTYPQVGYFAKWIRCHAAVEWLKISERGFQLDSLVDRTLLARNVRASLSAAKLIAADWRAVKRIGERSDLLIAIDFMALVLAACASDKPIAFWSHDFISIDERRHGRKINQLWMLAIKRALTKARNLIIQDKDRLRALEKSLGLTAEQLNLSIFFLPVSLPASTEQSQGRRLVKRQKPTVMQIGGLSAFRSNTDFLIEQYRKDDQRFELLLHGLVFPDIAASLSALSPCPLINDSFVSFDKISEVVQRCSIGFVGYRPGDEQFRLVKNASGQLVEYLRLGKPVVSMGHNDLGELLEDEGAGRKIRTSDEFFSAINEIHLNYDTFSQNAFALFSKRYDLAKYEAALLDFLKEVRLSKPENPLTLQGYLG